MRITQVAGLAIAAGCAGLSVGSGCADSHPASVDASPRAPVIPHVVVTPNPNSVLSATVTFDTDVPATHAARIQNTSPGQSANALSSPASTSPSTTHSIDLIGMRASSSFDLTLTATGANHASGTARTSFSTLALPAHLPAITTLVNDPARTSPGWTLFPAWYLTGSPEAVRNGSASSLVILDSELQIVWYYFATPSLVQTYESLGLTGTGPDVAIKLQNGHVAFLVAANGWAEIDMMGNLVETHTARGLNLANTNHELSQEPGGDLLTVSSQLKVVSGYPDGGGPLTYNVVGSLITEVGLDGGLLGEWSEFGMLNPFYEGDPNLFNANFWDTTYPGADGGTKDWTHDDAVDRDVNDGSLIVSSRTLSYVYKFVGSPGGATKLLWRLGPNGDFTLNSPGESWQYNQHAAYALPGSDHIMLFDDGNDRPAGAARCGTSGAAPCFSRAVEFALDTASMTASIVWQFRGDTPFYSSELGSSYVLANGDVLIDSGGESCVGACSGVAGAAGDFGGVVQSAMDQKHVDVFEVTHEMPPVTVAHFAIEVPFGAFRDDPSFSGYLAYRAIRIPTIY